VSTGRPDRARHRELPRSDDLRPPSAFVMRALQPVARTLVRRRFGVRVHGADRVPARGPVILAANHIGAMDGPLLVIFSPRPLHALTKEEMFRGRLGPLLHVAGQIPLDRFHSDPRAVRECVRTLRDGGAVGIFPEGTRGAGDLERFHHGAGYLAMVTGAPVVPVILLGTRAPGEDKHALPGRDGGVDIVFGAPWRVPKTLWPRRKAEVAAASASLRQHMRATLDDALSVTGRALPGPLPAPAETASRTLSKEHHD
jgi:1-acyl-sn-glycerol-3-phosphate acyltransferase